MKDDKKRLLVVAILLAVIVLIGGTYAWLTLTKTGTKTNIIKAGSLQLVLDDTTSNGILLQNAIPISDTKGLQTDAYTFTLENKGTMAADYTIYLDDIAIDTGKDRMDDKDVKYSLTKNGTDTNTALLSTLEDRKLDLGTINAKTTNSYTLRLWISSTAGNDVMGKIFNAKLRIEASQSTKTTPTKMCKRATTLHTETCNNSSSSGFCPADGYRIGSEITYGSLGTEGVLTGGDAFDCDVNGDGTYNSKTERFYYVSDVTNGITTDNDTAVLVYYNNVSGGEPSNSTTYAHYDAANENFHGPVTAVKQLPTTSQWKTTLTNTKRQITTETSTTSTTGGTLPVFDYTGYAARLLTAQEVNTGCGFTIGSTTTGELSTKCKYLMENTKYSNSSNKAYGEWLESPCAADANRVWHVSGYSRTVGNGSANYAGNFGVRPAIEVNKTDISY